MHRKYNAKRSWDADREYSRKADRIILPGYGDYVVHGAVFAGDGAGHPN
jgi:imidazoleglycerol phosphate synthase glutamine amidotransferase subunit HisH